MRSKSTKTAELDFKKILDAVYEMQLDGNVTTLEEAVGAARVLLPTN